MCGSPLLSRFDFDPTVDVVPGNIRVAVSPTSTQAEVADAIFGYTLVYDGVPDRVRRFLVHPLLNGLRVIDNKNDHFGDLRRELNARFIDCKVELVGCMALFSAVVPPRAPVN